MRVVCYLLVLPLVYCIQADAGDAKDDLKKMEGEWVEIYYENGDGSKFMPFPRKSPVATLTIKGRTMIFKADNEEKSRGAFTIDRKKEPKALDIKWTATKDVAETAELLVYAVDDNRLRICYAGRDGKRPASLSPVAKSGQECHVFKRKKSDTDPQLLDKAAKTLPQELKELQGRWDVVSQEVNGEKLPLSKDAEFAKLKVVIKGDQFALGVSEVDEEESTMAVNAKKNPKEIDLVGINEATKKTQKVLGIYHLQGDTLQMCFSGDDEKRPTTFATKEGTNQSLMVLQREK